VSIGDERPDYILNGVVAASRLSDGRIAIVLSRDTQVKYYSETGEHLRTVGGSGDGPGEYRRILSATRLPGDTMLVIALTPGMTWLTPHGDYVRSLPVNVAGGTRHPCRFSEGPMAFLDDGRMLLGFEEDTGRPGCGTPNDGLHRGTVLVEVDDYARRRFDTLAILAGMERVGRDQRVYGATTLVAARGERVYIADSATDTIRVFDSGGRRSIWRTTLDRLAVPGEATRERVQRRTYSDGRVEVREFNYPKWYPRVGRILVDATDHLWMMQYPTFVRPMPSTVLTTPIYFVVESGGAHWVVLDPSGHPVAQVRTPPGLFPLEIGEDYVLGVVRDRFDVETVRLYSLVRRQQ
jgi:hypothetical protein